MIPKTYSFDEIVQRAETNIRVFRLPKELTAQHVYIRILAQKREAGKTRFNNPNPTQIVYEIIETTDFLMRNKSRFDFIQAYHQIRLFGYELWIQSAKAQTLPVNVEKNILIEITTCKRMITKLKKGKDSYEAVESAKLIPNWDNPSYIKVQEKIINYESRLENALEEHRLFQSKNNVEKL